MMLKDAPLDSCFSIDGGTVEYVLGHCGAAPVTSFEAWQAIQALWTCAGADGQHACMAAIDLPADLPLLPSPTDALHLQHVLRDRFRIEASSSPNLSLRRHDVA